MSSVISYILAFCIPFMIGGLFGLFAAGSTDLFFIGNWTEFWRGFYFAFFLSVCLVIKDDIKKECKG